MVKDDFQITEKHGFLVTNFHSSHSGYKVTIIKKSNLTTSSAIFDIKPDDNFWVISIPEGEYTWRGIYVDTKHSEFRNEMDFKIESGKLNYIGDMVINISSDIETYTMGVLDQTEFAKERIEKDFPNLYERYRFVKNLTNDK